MFFLVPDLSSVSQLASWASTCGGDRVASRDFGAMMVVFIMGCLGVILAFIEYVLYSRGVLLDEVVTGTVTIANLMSCTVILFLLFGAVLATLRRRPRARQGSRPQRPFLEELPHTRSLIH